MQLKVLEVVIYARTSVIKAHLPISIDELVVTRPIEPLFSVAKCYFSNVDGLASAAYTSRYSYSCKITKTWGELCTQSSLFRRSQSFINRFSRFFGFGNAPKIIVLLGLKLLRRSVT